MVEITAWFALGAVGMAVGATVLAAGFRVVPRPNWRGDVLLVAVMLIALVAYALMALDLGIVRSQTRDPVYAVRYLDWLLTTPLHILYLGLIAGVATGALSRSLVLMAATVVFGFVGSVPAPPLQWAGFAAGLLSFVGVVYFLYGPFQRAALDKDGTTFAAFAKLRGFTVVLWFVYPVIWLLAPAGFGLMNSTTGTLVVAYLDVVTKLGFGLIALSWQLSTTSAESASPAPAD